MALGDQDNPYIVTTWADLVAKANISGTYVKVGANIDVLVEYPNGDAPTLVLNGYIDGDNKTISRWYCTESRYLIATNESCHYIKNCIFTNIKTKHSLCSIEVPSGYESYVVIDNCKFAGIMGDGSIFTPRQNDNYRNGTIRNITINIKGGNLILLRVAYGPDYVHYYNFNVKLISDAESLIYSRYTPRHLFFNDSQLELHMPNITRSVSQGSYCSLDNSVLDLYNATNNVVFSGENSAVSIFNKTHAPQTSQIQNKLVEIQDINWHNPTALAEAGFNIVTGS